MRLHVCASPVLGPQCVCVINGSVYPQMSAMSDPTNYGGSVMSTVPLGIDPPGVVGDIDGAGTKKEMRPREVRPAVSRGGR